MRKFSILNSFGISLELTNDIASGKFCDRRYRYKIPSEFLLELTLHQISGFLKLENEKSDLISRFGNKF